MFSFCVVQPQTTRGWQLKLFLQSRWELQLFSEKGTGCFGLAYQKVQSSGLKIEHSAVQHIIYPKPNSSEDCSVVPSYLFYITSQSHKSLHHIKEKSFVEFFLCFLYCYSFLHCKPYHTFPGITSWTTSTGTSSHISLIPKIKDEYKMNKYDQVNRCILHSLKAHTAVSWFTLTHSVT